MITIGLSN